MAANVSEHTVALLNAASDIRGHAHGLTKVAKHAVTFCTDPVETAAARRQVQQYIQRIRTLCDAVDARFGTVER